MTPSNPRRTAASPCADPRNSTETAQSAQSKKTAEAPVLFSRRQALAAGGAALLAGTTGCWSGSSNEVVVYCTLDEQFAKPTFAKFEKETGIQVSAKFDGEANKTVGLANALIAEADRPRADVFWNSEVLHTLRVERAGMLRPLPPGVETGRPSWALSPLRLWAGFAARGRVLLVNKERIPREHDRPLTIWSLTEHRFRGKCGMAKPLYGSTGTHCACLFDGLGEEGAKTFFDLVKANEVRVFSGNKPAAQAVGTGQVDWVVCDTDDAIDEVAAGRPVEIIFPDQPEDCMGTLLIPNTIGAVRGSPNPAAADKFIAYVLGAGMERALADGPSGQIPLRVDDPKSPPAMPAKLPGVHSVRAMEVNFRQAADHWDAMVSYFTASW